MKITMEVKVGRIFKIMKIDCGKVYKYKKFLKQKYLVIFYNKFN